MLYILVNEQKQAAWQAPYEALFARELTKLNIAFVVVTKDSEALTRLGPRDFLWIMHYKDLGGAQTWKPTMHCKIISTSNGTAANPYIYQVNPMVERMQMDAIDICLVFNKRQRGAMESLYEHPFFIETGFPVEVPKTKAVRRPKTIIVPGRVSPDRQFYLTTYLLQPLVDKGYEVLFAMPENESESCQYWLKLYHFENFIQRGFSFEYFSRGRFLQQLAESEFFFTSSLGDICSVSLAEAMMSGCYPIVPKFGKGLPTYDDVVPIGYAPFDQQSVELLINSKPKNFTLKWKKDMYDPAICAKKFVEGLVEYKKL